MVDVPEDIVFNTIMDWKKRDIHPVDRAKMVEAFRQEKGWSQRELARQMGISHSTIQDWLTFLKVDKEDLEDKNLNGVTNTDVHKYLRRNRDMTPEEIKEMNDIDYKLEKMCVEVSRMIPPKNVTVYTPKILHSLKDKLNRLEMYVEKNNR